MQLVTDFSKREDKNELVRVLRLLRPRRYRITIVEERDSRSDRQNRYYWGTIVKTLAAESGHTRDEIHEFLKTKFLGVEIEVKGTGERVRIPRSTSSLNTKEFSDFLEEIIAWAIADAGCYFEPPGDLIIQNS